MKIYKNTKGKHTVFVQPGNDVKTVSEWLDAEGNAILYSVEFIDGVAKVEANLGKYMIDNQLAKKSPIIIPDFSLSA